MAQVFPPRHVFFPSSTHTSTIIFLHGRGSNGPELAAQMARSSTSSGKSILDHFPSSRWVFPSARPRWSDAFQVSVGEWFNPDPPSEDPPGSDQDYEEEEELSISALEELKESVEYILHLVEEEVNRFDGDQDQGHRVVLGGLSQGMAVAIMALVCAQRRLGGLVGVMGWLPFAERIESLFDSGEATPGHGKEVFEQFFPVGFLQHHERWQSKNNGFRGSSCDTPVFLSHGEDDQWVDADLGLIAYKILVRLGFQKVDWKMYTGAPNDGHWLKEPEQFNAIVDFLKEVLGAHDS
ncbi:hypothetical protein ASPWEDRAFT_27745 [Aspergillus wentii DTO 134E9]|uniref:Acyl-protein thioesterase 1 n=1 Tax=Aspergillus wentii DTO 134E9 TaxID=1073089 RepID=A0A1L9RJJ8_ASPWE|nr:uncharacterized protein ASPWEDRAFT_27745 [Aspergillus wentii DTO 134E9]KAI9931972.1 hypothetical protein MW887_009473 [Aspergillus wentii]OJJ35071.1 hypothetical protein ASPWEDRAFT_27745 [Aspergillus wentii DTO 134E9]